jgi:hypothetical protein
MTRRASGVIFHRMNEKSGYPEILLQHRAKYLDHGANKLSLVEGGIDKGETAIKAAWREAGEETGIDKYCKYADFKKVAKRLTKGVYNVYLLDVDKLKCLKHWNPQPQKKFEHEMDMTIFPGGHIWVDVPILKKVVYKNVSLNGIYMWRLTQQFFKDEFFPNK